MRYEITISQGSCNMQRYRIFCPCKCNSHVQTRSQSKNQRLLKRQGQKNEVISYIFCCLTVACPDMPNRRHCHKKARSEGTKRGMVQKQSRMQVQQLMQAPGGVVATHGKSAQRQKGVEIGLHIRWLKNNIEDYLLLLLYCTRWIINAVFENT